MYKEAIQQPPYPQQAAYPQQQQQYPQGQPGVTQPAQYVAPQAPVNVVYQTAPNPTSNMWENYNGKASKVLGWIQVAAGFLCIIFNSIGMAVQTGRRYNSDEQYYYYRYQINGAFYVSSGIWGAIFFFISGGLAIGAGNKQTTCRIVGSMVMNIFSTIVGVVLLGTSAAAIGVEDNVNAPYNFYGGSDAKYKDDYTDHRTSLAMGVLLLLLSLLMIVVTIVTSGYACGAVCCGQRSPQTTQIVTGTSTTQYVVSGQPGAAGPVVLQAGPAYQQTQPAPVQYQAMQPQSYTQAQPGQAGYPQQGQPAPAYFQTQPMAYNPAHQQPGQPLQAEGQGFTGKVPEPPTYESIQ